MSDSASDNEEPEPYHRRLRKTTRSPQLIILSSDSDDDVQFVKGDCTLQPGIIACIARVKIEQLSDDDGKREKTRHASSRNSDSKKEKRNSSKEKTQRSENSNASNENSNEEGNSKSTSSNNPSLKGETSNSNVSRFVFRRKAPRWSTAYYKRKKILAKQSKRALGHPTKYMPRKNFRKKRGPRPVSKKQHNSDSVESSVQSEPVENEQDNGKSKKSVKTDESSSSMAVSQVKKRGRPKIIVDGIKKKRGRPKLSESEMRFRKKQRALVFGKNLIVKKRGRPKLSETNGTVKKKGRPKIQRDGTQPVTHSVRHVSVSSRTFVQSMNCFNESMKLYKCRECRKAAYNRSSWDMANSYCRFLEYRKLYAARNGNILSAGFLQPSDATDSDKRLWLPNVDNPPMSLTIETAKELLVQVGDQFCDLVQQEKEALSLHIGPAKSMTWKKLVQGVREMCDVCDTTLFNIHWVCPKCGFAVCVDCYKVRKQGIIIEDEESQMKGRDNYLWLFCHNRVPHEQNKLIMTQMVPGDALWKMSSTMHKVREKWHIGAYCKCNPQASVNSSRNCVDTGICKQLMSNVSKSFAAVSVNNNLPVADDLSFVNVNIPNCASKWLCDMQEEDYAFEKVMSETINSHSKNGMVPSFLRYEMVADIEDAFDTSLAGENDSECKPISISEIVKSVKKSKTRMKNDYMRDTVKEFNSRYPQPSGGREPLPLRIFTSTESSVAYKDIPHSWLCNGRLLLLHQPDHCGNLELFQEQWKRGQPIMVMAVDGKLDMSLWHPDGFCKDFGDIKNDLVNCKTGAIIANLPMKKFWLGFENFDERMKDDSGEYMLLKLKDWPPGEDFSEKLPMRFQDLMQGLPLPEYTHRDGIFNLAGRLPTWFVRPDLGPKMYNAYGSALFPTKGTTNLHLDVSDAVNVMVYVGIPHDGKDEHHILEALRAIDEGGCDSLTRERVRSKGVKPGALWHIYDSRNSDKIRDLLTKVGVERGEKIEAHHDPIHDQSWYLDSELRKRLYVEYGVEGYAIAQCLGDAVFIPAGAPHQVRNLHSCVKVAEDFVSPENIGHCFKLTQEFRHLSDTHTNHEDKLQIKNIIYHVVKDALSHLLVEKHNIPSFLENF